MDSQNIFDLFGRQKNIDPKIEEFVNSIEQDIKIRNKIDSQLNMLFSSFVKSVKDHLKRTDNLLNAISLSKSYISLNRKRIVNVKPSINANDVVVKSELNEVLNSIIKVGLDNTKNKKDLTDELINVKKYVEDLEKKLENELKFLFDGVNISIKHLSAEIVLMKDDIIDLKK